MPATSATPTMSAAAVRAVRLGLRIEFSRASVPVTPWSLGSGAPRNRATGRAMSGPSTKMPTKMSGMLKASINGLDRQPDHEQRARRAA